MLIDFSDILPIEGKSKEFKTDIEMKAFESRLGTYDVVDKKPMVIKITNLGKKTIYVESKIDLTLIMPCDRCLEDVKEHFDIEVSKEVDLNTLGTPGDESDDSRYITGTELDVEEFVFGEILLNLPMKVLCSTDCKGLCDRCNANLNHETCGCKAEELDPRMAKVLDVFNSFKEV